MYMYEKNDFVEVSENLATVSIKKYSYNKIFYKKNFVCRK